MRFLLKRYNSQYSLHKMLEFFDNNYPLLVTTGKNFSKFLLTSENHLRKKRKNYSWTFGEKIRGGKKVGRRKKISGGRKKSFEKKNKKTIDEILENNKKKVLR